ncbi:MAG: fucose isomerase [Patescibacteria group bacterium]|jgi:L-fucose isomerase-like protein|nr:fucose isomerase [Patescibacteria group bacterium]
MRIQNGSHVYLVSNGDMRESANQQCWPMQEKTLDAVGKAVSELGFTPIVVTRHDPERGHGFITKQAEGAQAIASIPPEAPVIVVLAAWAYSQQICGPLQAHQGPILVVANFDGTWPGLVALLNHSATLSRLAVKHSRLWSKDFTDEWFIAKLKEWFGTGEINHPNDHFVSGDSLNIDSPLAVELAVDIRTRKRILGQFDPGCMDMFNAVIDPALLGKTGLLMQFFSQSALVAKMKTVSDSEAQRCLNWLVGKSCRFDWGIDPEVHLTPEQVREQMKMYVAACRIVYEQRLDAIGIPYQIGLIDSCPASDLVEGMLNNCVRPPVRVSDGNEIIRRGECIPHFNEGDLGSAVPQVLMNEIYRANEMAPETTLHDVRVGHAWQDDFIWTLLISGGAPPAHFGGWKKTTAYRQPPMYFPLGGSTCSGVSKPGVITWARFYEAFGQIGLDCGTGEVVDLPDEEVQRRLDETTPVWPIMCAKLHGYGRDELMGTHMSNHITVGYGNILHELIVICRELGIPTRVTKASLS